MRDLNTSEVSEVELPFDLRLGDCLEQMRPMASDSVDAIVCDPPYEFGFMGKSWDSTGIANSVEMWREALRVLKPGGHLLAFSGSRTYHRMACAIEDAGFEIRDQIMWVYGSGFPKSLDVSKAIDKAAGAERFGTGEMVRAGCRAARGGDELVGSESVEAAKWKEVTVPATEAARQWEGWGTALKPAHEPICVARKPLIGTVAANVLAHGVGAMNIDGCRVEVLDAEYARNCSGDRGHAGTRSAEQEGATNLHAGGGTAAAGRWPANLIHDGSDEVLAAFPCTSSHDSGDSGGFRSPASETATNFKRGSMGSLPIGRGDNGSAARFFYCAKASRTDRNEGCGQLDRKPLHWSSGDQNPGSFQSEGTDKTSQNNHPTVKPTDLMAYLCRLVTPPGGLVLDPFMGSGSTGKACMREGFRFIGIDMTPEYVEIARARITHEWTAVKAAAEAAAVPAPQRDLFEEVV
jgi:site-specific DNA-methyltransferase (adenine-specific)